MLSETALLADDARAISAQSQATHQTRRLVIAPGGAAGWWIAVGHGLGASAPRTANRSWVTGRRNRKVDRRRHGTRRRRGELGRQAARWRARPTRPGGGPSFGDLAVSTPAAWWDFAHRPAGRSAGRRRAPDEQLRLDRRRQSVRQLVRGAFMSRQPLGSRSLSIPAPWERSSVVVGVFTALQRSRGSRRAASGSGSP